VPGTLKSLDAVAAKHDLMRIGKAIMVSISQIKELRRRSDGYFVYLGSGTSAAGQPLPVSRRKTPQLKRLLRRPDASETR
jgi:DNA-binding LytR/AlgR family response regulator